MTQTTTPAQGGRLTRATDFMRDNVNGDLVRSGRLTPSGALIYRMESGNIYRLSSAQVAILHRFRFKPRYTPAGRALLSQEGQS